MKTDCDDDLPVMDGASAAMEEKRFPKLPVVKSLVPARQTNTQDAASRRAELESLVAAFTGKIQVCPPDTTSAQMNGRRGVGRPRLDFR